MVICLFPLLQNVKKNTIGLELSRIKISDVVSIHLCNFAFILSNESPACICTILILFVKSYFYSREELLI